MSPKIIQCHLTFVTVLIEASRPLALRCSAFCAAEPNRIRETLRTRPPTTDSVLVPLPACGRGRVKEGNSTAQTRCKGPSPTLPRKRPQAGEGVKAARSRELKG